MNFSFLSNFNRFQPKAKAMYQCKFCEKTFSQAVYLKTHIRVHTGEKRYHCNGCDETFEEYRVLIKHKKTHHTFNCELCGKSFPLQSRLADHLKTHKGAKLECSQCKRLFASFHLLRMHLRLHAEESVAGDDFKANDSTNATVDDFKANDDDSTNVTTVLDSELSPNITNGPKELSILEKPPKSVEGKYVLPSTDVNAAANVSAIRHLQCTYCNKTFTRSSNLTKHLNIHTKERSFKCNDCDKTFLHSFALTRHMRVHTGEKPYKCVHCSKYFSDPSTRNRHAKLHIQKLKGNKDDDQAAAADNPALKYQVLKLHLNGAYSGNNGLADLNYSSVQQDNRLYSSFSKEMAGAEDVAENCQSSEEEDMQPVLEILSANQEQSFITCENDKKFDVINDL